MFNINDTVKYGLNGVCKISDIITRDFLGELVEYYVLTPINNRNSTIFVPVKNETLTSKMQYVLSKKDVYTLIEEHVSQSNFPWIEDKKARTVAFEKMLNSNDRKDIISLILTIKKQQNYLDSISKKLHASDLKILTEAETIMCEELSIALEIPSSSVPETIHTMLNDRLSDN